MKYSAEQFITTYRTMPSSIKEIASSDHTLDAIYQIGGQFKLGAQQVSDLSSQIAFLLVGLLPRDKFQQSVSDELHVDMQTAGAIVTEINKHILSPITEEMQNTPVKKPASQPRITQVKSGEEKLQITRKIEQAPGLRQNVDHMIPAQQRANTLTPKQKLPENQVRITEIQRSEGQKLWPDMEWRMEHVQEKNVPSTSTAGIQKDSAPKQPAVQSANRDALSKFRIISGVPGATLSSPRHENKEGLDKTLGFQKLAPKREYTNVSPLGKMESPESKQKNEVSSLKANVKTIKSPLVSPNPTPEETRKKITTQDLPKITILRKAPQTPLTKKDDVAPPPKTQQKTVRPNLPVIDENAAMIFPDKGGVRRVEQSANNEKHDPYRESIE